MAAIIVAAAFLLFFLGMNRTLDLYDEGIVLVDAARVMSGDLLHRDFYSVYGPAQYFLVGHVLSLSDNNFIWARMYDLVLRSLIIGSVFLIIARETNRIPALVAAGITGLWLFGAGTYLYPVIPCLLLAILGSYTVVLGARAAAPALLMACAGACTGVIALFRYDVGFLVLVSHFISTLALVRLSASRGTRLRRFLPFAVGYGGGVAVVFAPFAIAYLIAAPLGNFYTDIIDTSRNYRLMRALPFPGLDALRRRPAEAGVYLPLVAAAAALVELAFAERRRRRASSGGVDGATPLLLVFASCAGVLFLKGVVRVSSVHMLLAIVPAVMVCCILAALWWRRGAGGRIAALLVISAVLVPGAYFARTEIRDLLKARTISMAGWLAVRTGLAPVSARPPSCEATVAAGIARLGPDHARVANYLAAQSHPGERIFVGLDRHDKIFVNPVSLYFATGRLPGTHWHHFDPGLQTRADIQTKIIEDLRRNHVRWVVRDASYGGVNEPNGSAVSSGVVVLDRYLDRHYRPVAASGPVSVWLANGQTPEVGVSGPCVAATVAG